DARVASSGHGYIEGRFRVGAVSAAENARPCPPGEQFQIERGGVYLELLDNRSAIRLTDAQLRQHPRWEDLPDGHAPLRGLLGVRLTDADGRPNGSIMVSDKADGNDFSEEDEYMLNQLAAVASLALEKITAKQSAEHYQQHLRAVIDHIDEGVIVIDADGRIQSMNQAALAMYECPSAEAIQHDTLRHWQQIELYDKDRNPIDFQNYPTQRLLRDKRLVDFDAEVRNPVSGRSWMARFSGVALNDENGRLFCCVLTVRDITRDRHIQQTLRNTRDRLNDILASIQDGFMALDQNWCFTYVNDSATRFLATSAQKLIGRSIWTVFAESDHSVFYREFTRAVAQQRFIDFEAHYAPLECWFECRCYPTREGLTVLFNDTTRRHGLETALRDSEQRLKRVLAGSNDGYWEWNLSTGEIYVSPRWLEMLGYENTGQHMDWPAIEKMIHPEDLPRITHLLQRLEDDGRYGAPYDIEHRICHQQGYYLWVQTRGKVTRHGDSGKALLISGTMTDITERKKAQDLLHINEQVARNRLNEIEAIYQSAPVGLCVLDTQLRFVRLNERLAEITGIAVAGHIGRHIKEILPDLADIAEPVMRRVIETGVSVSHFEIHGATPAQPGVNRYWLMHCFPLNEPDGEINGLNVVTEEITERKKAEEKARHRAAELEAIMDAVPAHVLISHDPQGQYITGNRTAQEVLRLAPDANLSKLVPEDQQPGRFTITKNGREIPTEELPLQKASQGISIRDYEIDMVSVDGTVQTLYGNAEPIVDDHGNPRGAVGAFIDISDRKQAEARIREVNATLERRVQERTAQLESLNADLKRRARQLQVLALKLTEAEDRERRKLSEMLHDDLQQLLAAAKLQLGQLSETIDNKTQSLEIVKQIDQILAESVKKTRTLSHELSPSVLSREGFAAALDWLANQMHSKHGLFVEVDAAPDADPPSQPLRMFLYKAVSEILFNVVKHSGVHAARVSLCRTTDGIELTVSDEGNGFDPAEIQTDNHHASGLGLFSIQERINMLGGEMTIDSAPDQGCRFTLCVPDPDAAGKAKSATARQKQDASSSPAAERQILQVLVVDDHRMMREGLSTLLSQQPDIGTVEEAENGRQAIEKARHQQPDVILMDVSMPGINGIEATKKIKQIVPDTRIIALSMYDEPDIHVAMLEAGAVTYVPKAGPSETLLAAVRGETADPAETQS
ncbi:MAG: PAS domain S-box protein, partial [Thermodesulfobacteriota bacterium]